MSKTLKSYTDDGFVVNMKELVSMGNEWNKANPDGFVERINNQKLEHLATLIYTSGTTGTPKGVELLHDCWVFEAESIDRFKLIAPDDVHYLWLPLVTLFW